MFFKNIFGQSLLNKTAKTAKLFNRKNKPTKPKYVVII